MLDTFQSRRRKSLHVRVATAGVAALLSASLTSAQPDLPPRPRGAAGEAITAAEAKALGDWALAQPAVSARVKGHRVRLIQAGLTEAGKDARESVQAVLSFRDYDAGIVQQVLVNLESGLVELGEVARLVQPSPEEIAEGMAIVLRDPALASLAADPTLILMGGFHVKSPYPDDPCSREVCFQFAFMKPGANPAPAAEKKPPRAVIVNMTRQAVVNRDYGADNLRPGAPPPRMSAVAEKR